MTRIRAIAFVSVLLTAAGTMGIIHWTYSAYTPNEPSVVFAYLPAPTDTTITTAGDYYPVAGSFTNEPILGWSFVTDHIEYDLNKPRCHLFAISTVFSVDSPLATVNVAISVNGTPRTATQQGTICKTAGDSYHISVIDLFMINSGDEIQLMLTSDGDGDVVTVNTFNVTLVKIGD
jgi:hypothetical protein